MTLLVFASASMYIKSLSTEKSVQTPEAPDTIVEIKGEKEFKSLSLADVYEKRISDLEKNQENVLADIRQESNNIINKFNGWLAFWTAILAIFGGIIPIVLQYILREKSKKEMHDMFESLKSRAIDHQIQLLVSSIELDHECSIVSDSAEKKTFIRMLIADTNKNLQELIDTIDNDQGFLSRQVEMHVITGLIQYCRLIDLLKVNAERRQHRDLNELETKIKSLIMNILQHQKYSREEVWSKFMDLVPRLTALANI